MIKLLAIVIVFTTFAVSTAQQNYTISGHVRDKESGEELIGTTIYVKALQSGTSSNVYGFYSLTIPEGIYLVRYSMIGYDAYEIEIELTNDIRHDIELKSSAVRGQDEIVTAEAPDRNVKSVEMGTVEINPAQVKSVPVLFGEQDLLKTLQLLPGVQAGRRGETAVSMSGAEVPTRTFCFWMRAWSTTPRIYWDFSRYSTPMLSRMPFFTKDRPRPSMGDDCPRCWI